MFEKSGYLVDNSYVFYMHKTACMLQPINLETIEVTHSIRGNKLQNTIKLQLPKPKGPGERIIQEYVIYAFSGKMSALIAFTFQNNTILELAKHLKGHTTGSSATLYQYVYGVYRFSKWIKKNPDTIIQESKNAPDKYVRAMHACEKRPRKRNSPSPHPRRSRNYQMGNTTITTLSSDQKQRNI